MEAMVQEMPENALSYALIDDQLTATEGGGCVLTPPYPGVYVYRNFSTAPNSQFGSAVRQYKDRGEIVAQLWDKRQVEAFGRLESGLRINFQAKASGKHRILARVDAGPITRIHATATYLRAFIPGFGGTFGSVASNQTTHLTFTANLKEDHNYQLIVAGGVTVLSRPGQRPSYGEVIATFPRVSVRPTAVQSALGSFDADLQKALAAHDNPAEAAAALSATMDEGEIVLD